MINIMLTVVQIVGGILSGSLALIADAIHNLSDALSLGLAFFARKIAQRPTDDTMTFGYGRAEVVAALINYTTLILLGLYLMYEAILRLFDPTDDHVKEAVKATLRDRFGLSHITLELGRHSDACDNAQVVGHTPATN